MQKYMYMNIHVSIENFNKKKSFVTNFMRAGSGGDVFVCETE